MDYEMLRKATNQGWNTWNTSNVLSFAHLPEGFAINLALQDAFAIPVLREALVGRFGEKDEKIIPGARTYDGRYAELNLTYGTSEINVKSAVKDDEQIIYIEPVKHGLQYTKLCVEACIFWGKDGSLEKKDDRLFGKFKDRTFEIFISSPTVTSVFTFSLSPSVSVILSEPVVISTKKMTVDEALAIIAENKAALDAENNSYGKHSEAYTAMKTCLAWDTIYEQEHDRICSPVSRIWNMSWAGYVLFDWDTYFASLMASIDNKELAFLNAIAITDEVTENGFVPSFGAAFDNKTRGRSQPPVGAFVCLDIYRRWPEKWFLERVFPTLLSWNKWYAARRTTPEGYMCWGENRYEEITGRYWDRDFDDVQCARFESGLDNSPMYDDQGFDFEGQMMTLADVGLMGLYISDCEALSEIAKILGHEDDIAGILERKDKVENALMTLWDDDFGMFLNKDLRDGKLSRRLSATNFYALSSRRITDTQKRRIIDEHFYNTDEFWGDWVIPMTPRNDPAFKDQDYWRGRIWGPTNYLVYRVLKQAGLKKECDALAEKSEQLILQEWRLHGHVHENYSGYDGMGCGVGNSDKFYHWGGLLAYIAIDNEQS